MGQVVEKCADGFDANHWQKNQWSTAQVQLQLTDACPDVTPVNGQALRITASFSGKGFEHLLIEPQQALQVPGKLKRISFWARVDQEGSNYPWIISFTDGWGMAKDDHNRKLEYSMGKKLSNDWQLFSFDIPKDWVQPLRINGFVTHNYSARDHAGKSSLCVDQLLVETDITDVDQATGKLKGWESGPALKDGKPAQQPVPALLSTNVTTTQIHNIFAGRQPTLKIAARSWLPGSRKGTFTWSVKDNQGKPVASDTQPVRVESELAMSVPLQLPRFGLYTTDATMQWEDGTRVAESMKLAYLPKAAQLTPAQKEQSPYGLNVHGGRSRMVQSFRDAGMVWFRDYAFNYKWMVRAKGADKSYKGWPWYPPLVKEYDDAGAVLLACHADGIADFKDSNSTDADAMKPDLNWTREMVDLILAFPSIKYHELDNEYDLPSQGNAKYEIPKGWPNYQNYHKKFGDIINLIGDGSLVAVENGRAGTWPQRLEKDIASGAFANIDVVNTHHYCGVDAPELNVNNKNTDGVTQTIPKLYFDQLRDVRQIGSMDGKQRQHWVTEFGWDTKAGYVVSHLQEAAYLQRGYMMFLATGVQRAFWFFDLDSPDANNFFDGCGLVDDKQKPKLALCAFSALAHLLPVPRYVGMINSGPGTWGYVFEDAGQYTAAMWTLENTQGPSVRFVGAKLYDYLANPIAGDTVQLGLTPVFAQGIMPSSDWFAQTAYQLASPLMESVTSGDTITATLTITNNRDTSINGRVELALPLGWKSSVKDLSFTCAVGETTTVDLAFTLAADASVGESAVQINVSESGTVVKTLPLRVRVQKRLAMTATSLVGEPGQAVTHVKLTNSSASQSLTGQLKIALPGSWKTPSSTIVVKQIAPRQTLEMDVPITWNAQWSASESAGLSFVANNGEKVSVNLSPGQIAIQPGKAIVIDGDLKDWSTVQQIPDWVLGASAHEADARLYMAWTTDGLLLAGDVADSQLHNSDPRSFWNCDVLELFLDTNHTKGKRSFASGDHQFWFVPMPDENRVYVGQWKRGDEIKATRFDITNIKTSCRRSSNGYVFEMLLPASEIVGFKAQPQTRLGMNLNLGIHGKLGSREVYWPQSKQLGDVTNPAGWGTIILK
jgi:hypothetical protein